jgi:hypothetical protein
VREFIFYTWLLCLSLTCISPSNGLSQPISHFKSEDGLQIPTPSVPQKSYDREKKSIDDAVYQIYKDFEKTAEKLPRPEFPDGKELFPCTKSRSFSDKAMEGANIDVLLVEKGKSPPEPEVSLGAKVIVMPYSHKEYSLAHTFVEEFEVNCLPTRIRVVNGVVRKLEGDKAYLNFELSENGEEHQFIKKWRKAQ